MYRIHKSIFWGETMQNCSNLYFLTTLAYQLADCLSGDELTILAADLVAMADLLANIVAKND